MEYSCETNIFFFFSKKKQQNGSNDKIIDGKLHLVNDTDQTSIVTVRPKYYNGSSGSIWASETAETMLLRREIPRLYEISN